METLSKRDRALAFITKESTKKSNLECRIGTEETPKKNYCDIHCLFKVESAKDPFEKRYRSSESKFCFLGSDKEFCRNISSTPSKQGILEAIFATEGFDEFSRSLNNSPTHTEAWQLNNILKELVQNDSQINDIDFLYLHTAYSPCDSCNETLIKFVKAFKVDIFVTYDKHYSDGLRYHMEAIENHRSADVYDENANLKPSLFGKSFVLLYTP